MNKTICAILVISLMHAVIVQAMQKAKSPIQPPPRTSRCCGFLSSEPSYAPLPEHPQAAHVIQSDDKAVAYSAFQGKNRSLTGSNEILLAENEMLIYGFKAPTEKVATHLNETLPTNIRKLKNTQELRNKLAGMMYSTMLDFFTKDETVDPCNIDNQKVLIGFIHLLNTQYYPYVLHCKDNGTFQRMNNDPYYSYNPDRYSLLFIPGQSTSNAVSSPIYNLLRTNKMASEAMMERPAELAKKLMQTNENKELKALILIDNAQWLKVCKCPETTAIYKTLKQKWDACTLGSVVVENDPRVVEILEHKSDSSKQLAQFKKELLTKTGPKKDDEEPSLEDQARFVFLDHMIQEKQNSTTERLTNLLASFINCGSR